MLAAIGNFSPLVRVAIVLVGSSLSLALLTVPFMYHRASFKIFYGTPKSIKIPLLLKGAGFAASFGLIFSVCALTLEPTTAKVFHDMYSIAVLEVFALSYFEFFW